MLMTLQHLHHLTVLAADTSIRPKDLGLRMDGFTTPTLMSRTAGYQSPYTGNANDAGTNASRFCMAFPNTNWRWATSAGNNLSSSVSFRFDISINGVTQEYQVSLSNFQGAEDSLVGGKQLIFHINN